MLKTRINVGGCHAKQKYWRNCFPRISQGLKISSSKDSLDNECIDTWIMCGM